MPEYYIYGMFCAFHEENIKIIEEAGSLIDGQDCFDANGEEGFRGPMGIIMSSCQNITLEGYTFSNCANWSHQLDSCQNINIRKVTVLAGHDGFNLHHCKDINVSNCCLKSGDDCFAGYDITNLQVCNCYLNTACNALRIGGKDIFFTDCIFEGPGQYPHLSSDTLRTHSLFKYYSLAVDNVEYEGKNIIFKDCQIKNMNTLLSYQQGSKKLLQDHQVLRPLIFDGITITDIEEPSLFLGNGESAELIIKNGHCDKG